MKHISYLVILSLATAACSDELGKKPENKVEIVNFSQESIVSEVLATSEPNQYQVVIRWKPTSESITVMNAQTKKRSTLDSATHEFSEIVEGGKTHKYQIEVFKNGKSTAVHSSLIEVKTPYDLVLAGDKVLTGDLVATAERIFIKSNAKIRAKKYKIILKAKELIAQGGVLQSYGPDEKECPTNMDGYPGGDITIDAEIASGNLTVNMMGATACQTHGGAGGKLIVRAKQGQSLSLNLNFGASKGVPPPQRFLPGGNPGSLPTSCIALAGEESCN